VLTAALRYGYRKFRKLTAGSESRGSSLSAVDDFHWHCRLPRLVQRLFHLAQQPPHPHRLTPIRDRFHRPQPVPVISVSLTPGRTGTFATMQAAAAVRHSRLLAKRTSPRLCPATGRVRRIAGRITVLQSAARHEVVDHFGFPPPGRDPRCFQSMAGNVGSRNTVLSISYRRMAGF
jgi:hypothetical protein